MAKVKQTKIFAIARILDSGKNLLGMRLIQMPEKQVQNVPLNSIKKVLSNPATAEVVVNLRMAPDGSVVGINGVISRYPAIYADGSLVDKAQSPLIILNKIGDDGVGYTVCDYAGRVKRAKASEVLAYAKANGIANGKVGTREGIEFISPIFGEYDVEKVSRSTKDSGNLNVNIYIPNDIKDTGSVARHAKQEIGDSIRENDVFRSMTSEQKQVLKDYYTWYTVKVYEQLAKSTRLDLALGKAEKLAQLRGIEEWKFGGVWDTGFNGGGKCELGHSLRYEYYAIPATEADKVIAPGSSARRGESYRKRLESSDYKIIFGETCASDFFNIRPDEMKKLVKTRKIMSDEIEEMAGILANGLETDQKRKCALLYEIIKRLESNSGLEGIYKVFGKRVGITLLQFIKTNMPFPFSLVIEAANEFRSNREKSFGLLFPFYSSEIADIYNRKAKHWLSGRELLDFFADFAIEGSYMYDPFDKDKKRKDVGRYNDKTRGERATLLRSIRVGTKVRDFTLVNIERYLKAMSIYESIYRQFLLGVPGIETVTYHGEKCTAKNLENERLYWAMHRWSYTKYMNNPEIVSSNLKLLGIVHSSISGESYRFPARCCDLKAESWDGFSQFRNLEEADQVITDVKDYCSSSGGILPKFIELMKLYYADKERKDIFNKELSYDTIREAVEYGAFKIHDDSERGLVCDIGDVTLEYSEVYPEIADMVQYVSMGIDKKDIANHVYRLVENLRDGKTRAEDYKKLTDYIENAVETGRKNKKTTETTDEAIGNKLESTVEDKPKEKQEPGLNFYGTWYSEKEVISGLKDLLNRSGVPEDDYGVKVSRDILSRGSDFSGLTYRQKWRLVNTYVELKKLFGIEGEAGKKPEQSTSELPADRKRLSEHPEVQKMITKLFEDGVDTSAIYKATPIGLKVARSIQRTGVYSDKQLKHIKLAYEAIGGR